MHTLQPGNNSAFLLGITLRYSNSMLKSVYDNRYRLCYDKIKKIKLNVLLNVCYYPTYIHIQCVLC